MSLKDTMMMVKVAVNGFREMTNDLARLLRDWNEPSDEDMAAYTVVATKVSMLHQALVQLEHQGRFSDSKPEALQLSTAEVGKQFRELGEFIEGLAKPQ